MFSTMFFKGFLVFLWIIASINQAEAGAINSTKDRNLSEMRKFSIDKCRQQCFLKTMDDFRNFRQGLESKETLDTCQKNSNCFMCYDYCRVLVVAKEDLAKSMCNDGIYCMKGCQIACHAHRLETHRSLAYKLINNS